MLLQLTPELREQVYLLLNAEDLKQLSCCNRELNAVLKIHLWRTIRVTISQLSCGDFRKKHNLEYLKFTKTLRIVNGDDGDVSYKQRKQQIHTNYNVLLNFSNPLHFHTCIFYDLSKLSNLKELHLCESDYNKNNDIVRVCNSCTSGLMKLNIQGIPGVSLKLISLEQLQTLKELNVGVCELSDDAMHYISSLVSLVHLDVRMNYLSDDGLRYLSNLKNLIELNIAYIDGITGAAMKFLTPLISLKKLNVSYTYISDTGMLYISSLKSLERLNIRDTLITDIGIKHVTTLENLKELNVGLNSELSDSAMEHIPRLKYLTVLIADMCRLADKACSSLSNLHSLRKLNLSTTFIGDEGLKSLCNLHNLEDLRVSDCRITDASVLHLRSLTLMKKIDLSENSVSNDFLVRLQDYMKTLMIINEEDEDVDEFFSTRWDED